MIDKAIEKITKEAMDMNDPFATFIEEHLTELCTSDAVAEKILKLEAEKAKLSNTALMEFKVYIDQLQDIYIRLNDMISEESINDEEMGGKMRAALKTIIERWNV